ncbi:hypothetical protein EPN16_02855 [bacterium]|nr:MAG: hypothetical protein EPN16_02855 [bacterium]
MNNKRGSVLVVSFMVILVLAVLGGIMLSRSISERALTQRYAESTQAFWLAEAGVNRALKELGANFNAMGNNVWSETLAPGSYSIDIEQVDSTKRKVTSHGFVPAVSPRVERVLEATITKKIPPDFYENAIYSGGSVDFNGNSYTVTGKVRYADEIEYSSNNVNGTITEDPDIKPLAMLDFQQLYNLSLAQQNVYVVDHNKLVNQATGSDDFPGSFWYDAQSGIPNIVYIDGDLALNGNIGTIGGFFVVVGDVLTNPDDIQNANINGNGVVQGVIYTRGEFKINGGAGRLNVDGGVWAGEQAVLNGNADVTYNQVYMDAIRDLNINAQAQVTAWKDTQNPYALSQ